MIHKGSKIYNRLRLETFTWLVIPPFKFNIFSAYYVRYSGNWSWKDNELETQDKQCNVQKERDKKKQTVVDKVLYRKLTIKHHESHNKPEVNLALWKDKQFLLH